MDLGFAGKRVLVTGGSRGIGLAIAHAFLAEGASVAIVARNGAGLKQAGKYLGNASSEHAADVTDFAAVQTVMSEVKNRLGGIDILITAVGSGASVPPGKETAAEWQHVVALNLFSATNCIEAATPILAESACGSIVCISSICGIEMVPGAPVTYSAAKAALNAVVRGLARPLAEQGIRINAVAPGNVLVSGGTWDRKLTENAERVMTMLKSEVAQARLGRPEWIADAVLFLASPRATFVTGSVQCVDGGQTRN